MVDKTNKNNENLIGGEKEESEEMSVYTYNGRTYYTSRREAESVARRYDVILYSNAVRAYYIRRPSKTPASFFRW